MFSFLYNCALFVFFLCLLPKFIWQVCFLGKYRNSLKQRLGLALPPVSLNPGQKLLWIHAVSVGETRAVIPLYRQLKAQFPNMAIVISTTTETGCEEAKRSLPGAHAHFFLPFDFSWIVKKYLDHFRPSYLILVESDFWYQLLSQAKKRGAHIFLINGKISERSTQRFQKIPAFSRALFSCFDIFCVQNALYRERFLSLGAPEHKLHVTGNIKLDLAPQILSAEQKHAFREELGINPRDPILVIGSSHEPEEEWLLSALDTVWQEVPALKVLLVPRHPERFAKVAQLLKERGIDTLTYSQRAQKKGGEKVVLIDAMGLLNSCYQIAQIAIVAGSFASHVGGHNIFEPVVFHVPVLFGPHMQGQPDLTQLILQSHAGKQVALEELPQTLLEWLTQPQLYRHHVSACDALCIQVKGSTQRTLEQILPYFHS